MNWYYAINILPCPDLLQNYLKITSYTNFLFTQMSQRCLLYVMNVLKTSFVCYMDVLKTSFVCYECPKDVLGTSCVLLVRLIVQNVFCMLWMSQRCLRNVLCSSGKINHTECLLYVMNVLKTSFVCYECFKDVFCLLWMS